MASVSPGAEMATCFKYFISSFSAVLFILPFLRTAYPDFHVVETATIQSGKNAVLEADRRLPRALDERGFRLHLAPALHYNQLRLTRMSSKHSNSTMP